MPNRRVPAAGAAVSRSKDDEARSTIINDEDIDRLDQVRELILTCSCAAYWIEHADPEKRAGIADAVGGCLDLAGELVVQVADVLLRAGLAEHRREQRKAEAA